MYFIASSLRRTLVHAGHVDPYMLYQTKTIVKPSYFKLALWKGVNAQAAGLRLCNGTPRACFRNGFALVSEGHRFARHPTAPMSLMQRLVSEVCSCSRLFTLVNQWTFKPAYLQKHLLNKSGLTIRLSIVLIPSTIKKEAVSFRRQPLNNIWSWLFWKAFL